MGKKYILILLCIACFAILAKGGDITTLKSNYLKMLVPQKTDKDTLLNDLIQLPM